MTDNVYEIVAIHTQDPTPVFPDEIISVKLRSGLIETKQQVVDYIDAKMIYFYTTPGNPEDVTLVETVHPSTGEPYIRTRENSTTLDNLLSLPRF